MSTEISHHGPIKLVRVQVCASPVEFSSVRFSLEDRRDDSSTEICLFANGCEVMGYIGAFEDAIAQLKESSYYRAPQQEETILGKISAAIKGS